MNCPTSGFIVDFRANRPSRHQLDPIPNLNLLLNH